MKDCIPVVLLQRLVEPKQHTEPATRGGEPVILEDTGLSLKRNK